MSSAADNVVRLKDLRAGELVDQVTKTVGSMADQLSQSVQGWGSRAKVAARSTDGFVRASPWQAVGIIALAGLAAGLLVSYAARGRRSDAVPEGGESADETSGG